MNCTECLGYFPTNDEYQQHKCPLEAHEVVNTLLDGLYALEQKLKAAEQSLECGQKDMDYLRGRLEAVEKERDALLPHNWHNRTNAEAGSEMIALIVELRTQLTTAEAELRAAREALKGLLQYMGQTCNETGNLNGVSIEEGHTTSKRFHAAWLTAVDVMEGKAALTPGGTNDQG